MSECPLIRILNIMFNVIYVMQIFCSVFCCLLQFIVLFSYNSLFYLILFIHHYLTQQAEDCDLELSFCFNDDEMTHDLKTEHHIQLQYGVQFVMSNHELDHLTTEYYRFKVLHFCHNNMLLFLETVLIFFSFLQNTHSQDVPSTSKQHTNTSLFFESINAVVSCCVSMKIYIQTVNQKSVFFFFI